MPCRRLSGSSRPTSTTWPPIPAHIHSRRAAASTTKSSALSLGPQNPSAVRRSRKTSSLSPSFRAWCSPASLLHGFPDMRAPWLSHRLASLALPTTSSRTTSNRRGWGGATPWQDLPRLDPDVSSSLRAIRILKTSEPRGLPPPVQRILIRQRSCAGRQHVQRTRAVPRPHTSARIYSRQPPRPVSARLPCPISDSPPCLHYQLPLPRRD